MFLELIYTKSVLEPTMVRMKKTVLRTIRIDEELDKVLGADSEAKSVSFNTLVTQILIKYADWDRFVD